MFFSVGVLFLLLVVPFCLMLGSLCFPRRFRLASLPFLAHLARRFHQVSNLVWIADIKNGNILRIRVQRFFEGTKPSLESGIMIGRYVTWSCIGPARVIVYFRPLARLLQRGCSMFW